MQDADIAEVLAREQALMDPAVRASPGAAADLLAPDAREFGSSGTAYDRNALLGMLADEEPAGWPETTDVDARPLAPDVVLLTYRAHRPGRSTLRSSVWRRDAEGWRLVFHQGTPAPEGPDTPG